jgi:hypothetical protein
MAKTKKPFDQEGVLELWQKGRTIRQIAEAVGCSRVYAHRLLSTKFRAQYLAGVKAQRDTRDKAGRAL